MCVECNSVVSYAHPVFDVCLRNFRVFSALRCGATHSRKILIPRLYWLPPPRCPRSLVSRCGYASVKDYLLGLIAAHLALDEEDTVLSSDGRFVSRVDATDQYGSPINV